MKKNLVLEDVVLEKGTHPPNNGMCAMELAARLAGERHTDHPKCVSPVLSAFLRNWNDSVDDEFRQRLKPFIPRVINTAGDGKDEIRAWMATDWLVRVCAPAWLDLARLTEQAMALRTAEQITNSQQAKTLYPKIAAAWAAAWAAWDAGAAGAAWDAAWAAGAAWDAAWAAWDAGAAGAAWDAAWAARDAGAAWAAAWAARDAAWAALQPTVATLQESALDLLDRMIEAHSAV